MRFDQNGLRQLRVAIDAPESPAADESHLSRVAVRVRDHTQILHIADVHWIEAAGNYVRLHITRDAFLFRASMNGIEQRLDPRQFVRIHRSTIVNVDRIVELHPTFSRELLVVLADGTQLRLSDSFRERLSALVHGL